MVIDEIYFLFVLNEPVEADVSMLHEKACEPLIDHVSGASEPVVLVTLMVRDVPSWLVTVPVMVPVAAPEPVAVTVRPGPYGTKVL